jgi:hypothetical protein
MADGIEAMQDLSFNNETITAEILLLPVLHYSEKFTPVSFCRMQVQCGSNGILKRSNGAGSSITVYKT